MFVFVMLILIAMGLSHVVQISLSEFHKVMKLPSGPLEYHHIITLPHSNIVQYDLICGLGSRLVQILLLTSVLEADIPFFL